nr:MAG TPA: Gamma-aminobutyric acid receptor subunit alpha-1, PTX, Membrane, Channel, Nanobody [Caudoviricetes sp.]
MQCFVIAFLLFNIVYSILTNNKYTLSLMLSCLLGV